MMPSSRVSSTFLTKIRPIVITSNIQTLKNGVLFISIYHERHEHAECGEKVPGIVVITNRDNQTMNFTIVVVESDL